MRNEELGMKVAASQQVYGAMSEGLRWQVFRVSPAFPSRGRCPVGGIGHSRHERQMRKAEKCAAHVGKRESQAANDKDFSLRSK